MRSNISNSDVRDIITEIMGGDAITGKTILNVSAAVGTKEKASFDALIGSDNGHSVFLMLKDNHEAMGGKTVTKVHVYSELKGDDTRKNLIWELS